MVYCVYNPVQIMTDIINYLYPDQTVEVAFVSGLYDEEGVYAGSDPTQTPSTIYIDVETPIFNVANEMAEQFAAIITDTFEQEDEDLQQVYLYLMNTYTSRASEFNVYNFDEGSLH